ncbi:uncharacterized protein LOC117646406 [Thrips palmi]|uniref:Uncharacterized protein LOC117646406 n=1 Tax=Thrips palmi TaxID=161013 RepID=A0A6P8ZNZ1_THRPL|nr:uncharacterized protein LOC117646406 [Thrips palmi]
MKVATVILPALGLLLAAQQAVSDTHYDNFVATHGWKFGHYVGACTLAAYNKYPQFGAAAWAGVCTCHTRAVQVSQVGGVNIGPYMRSVITCTLTSVVPGVAVIGAEIIHCTAGKINTYVGQGGK